MDVYPKLQFVTLKEQTDRQTDGRTDGHPYSINIDRYNMGLGLRPSIDTLHYITLHKNPCVALRVQSIQMSGTTSDADGPSALILKKKNLGENNIHFLTNSLIIHDLINYS